jgi:hypothetical protein
MNDFPIALLAILVIAGIIVISVALLRRKPSKGNSQYNLVHNSAELTTSVPEKKNRNSYNPSSNLSFPFSHVELALVLICLKHFQRIIKDTEQQKHSTLINKLSAAYDAVSDSPYDSLIDLDSEEALLIDNALHNMMTDALMAQKFGSIADTQIDGRSISELAKHVILMRDILRRLTISTQMQLFQTQLDILKRGQEN